MRIAQVAPLIEAVPPPKYGGTERIVSYLTEQLVADGYDVTLFASGDSHTRAHLVPVCDRALRLDGRTDHIPYHVLQVGRLLDCVESFDIVHFHTDLLHFPIADRMSTPSLTTLHGRLDLPELKACFYEFRHLPFVAISHHQRRPMPWLNWGATVYHGLPRDLYRFQDHPSDYIAFVGRLSPEKRVDRAIEIAERAGRRLIIGAKVDQHDRDYFEARIEPLLSKPHVEFVGEISDREKNELLGGAAGMVFPIDWPEPFGMVLIEAFACGTPVIAYDNGSVPELIDHGVTGFITSSIEEAVEAVDNLGSLDRRRCRDEFERRFSAERMAEDYVALYENLLEERGVDADPYSDRWSGNTAQRSAGA